MENTNSNSSSSNQGAEKSQIKATMKSSQLMKLFVDEIKDIYWAENALLKAIPTLIDNATSPELIEVLTAHLGETKVHIERLEMVFSLIDVKASAEKCLVMEGLINESKFIMDECEQGSMRDAGIISAAQKIEHYEIATYGTLKQFAQTMNLTEVEELLEITLEEEKESDLKLSDVAMDAINIEASEETV